MFTFVQYILEERLIYGIISDVLFFGSLWWGYKMKSRSKFE